MALHRKLSEQLVVLLHLIIGVQLVLAAPQPNDPSCNRICGSVNIPYPFGTSEGCYLDKSFLIKCNNSFQPPKPFLAVDNIEVLNISTDDGELRVSNLVFRSCEWWPVYDNQPSLRRISALHNLSNFRISHEKNSIFAVGCNFFAYISGWKGQHYKFMSGCTSFCGKSTGLVNGSCSGLGCCHSAIPENATKYNLTVQSIYTNGSSRTTRQSCGLGFIGETQAYTFSTLDFENLMNRETVPLLLDWAIANKKCEDAQKNWSSYLCKAANSNCSEPNALGYICKCPEGYQGNPYILDGKDGSCQDIDECKDHPNPCNANATCINTNGSYQCTCLEGYKGDGRMPPGTGCSKKPGQSKIIINIALELLTGEKALSMDRPEAERNLAMYFVTAMKEDRLLQIIDDHILIEGNIEEIKEVANIAKKCLKVRGEDRPSMKQVTKELEGLRLLEKHSLKKVDSNIQQITKHLPYASTHALGIDVDVGSSSMSTIVADDSMKNQILKPTDNDAR